MSRKEERIKKLAYAAHSEKTVHTWNDQLKKIKQKKPKASLIRLPHARKENSYICFRFICCQFELHTFTLRGMTKVKKPEITVRPKIYTHIHNKEYQFPFMLLHTFFVPYIFGNINGIKLSYYTIESTEW